MLKKVSFSRHVEKDWLDQTALWCTDNLDKKEIVTKINTMLTPWITCKINLGKTRNQLTSIWIDIPGNIPSRFQKFACDKVRGSSDIPLAIHWGLLIAKKKFFAEVARFIGRTTKLNCSFTYAQVQKRMVELYGDTETVKRHLRSVLKTLVEFGVVIRSSSRSYQVADRKLVVNSDLKNWLLYSLLISEEVMSRSLPDIIDDAIWFPFDFNVQANEIEQSWFELHQQGNDLVIFRK
ncbi:hypothetical protein LCGC14_0467810 [marine sediment metagenome]|uniref:Uncharacterized protein n=1 Tax=marine sediment metagenome TaxID=412755 RepID=A0A0F9SIE4_9ZZZZ|nr:hypothetical protein [Methylophaga sp.]HEC58783.1 hypothetical protein [Methylophaga sp.]